MVQVNSGFDFSSLRKPYAKKEEISSFVSHLQDDPVSGAILNPNIFSKEKRKVAFHDLREDEKDELLFRFDKKKYPLGKTLEQAAGAFYILDPSSAYPSYFLASLLPKDFVSIDLCAAPGGKSIALDFRREDGLYLANDLSYTRAIEIQKNADKLGLNNLLSFSRDPKKLNLASCFDLVILDAPCSGSGRIRKEEKRKEDFSLDKVLRLLPVQEELLEKAVSLLKEGGYLCYSTCSLSIEEDEEQVNKIRKKHPELELLSLDVSKDVIKGKKNVGYHRIPGIYDGEGIYFTIRKKTKGDKYSLTPSSLKNHVFSYRKTEYNAQRRYKEMESLPYISPGLKRKDTSPYPKCEYDYAYSKKIQGLPVIQLERREAIDYLSGNQIRIESKEKDGLVVLAYNNRRLGFGKKIKNQIKNYLPKGLRLNCD